MVVENMLGGPLPEKYEHLETCSRVHGDTEEVEGRHRGEGGPGGASVIVMINFSNLSIH